MSASLLLQYLAIALAVLASAVFVLKRQFPSAVRRLRIPSWQASVTGKQQLLSQTYGLLKGEVDTDRALTLEATIVLLIVLEIAFAFMKIL